MHSSPRSKQDRHSALMRMLQARRQERVAEVKVRSKDLQETISPKQITETYEVDIKEEIEFALIQMKTEEITKIDAALRRLEAGCYGDCFECGNEISEVRLRGLPFAVRCKECEEAWETAELRERMRRR